MNKKKLFSGFKLIAMLLAFFALSTFISSCSDVEEEADPSSSEGETETNTNTDADTTEASNETEESDTYNYEVPEDETEDEEEDTTETESTGSETSTSTGYTLPSTYDGDFEAYQEVNSEIIAWIQVSGTEIDYPVCQSESDNSYYLTHTAARTYSVFGAIYIESYSSADFSDFNTVVYGHNNRSNDDEFTQLHYFEDESFFNSNKTITVYLQDGTCLTYTIFAAYTSDNSHILLTNDFSTSTGRLAYLSEVAEDAEANGWYDESIEVDESSQILTLSTCILDDKSHRWIVLAVLD